LTPPPEGIRVRHSQRILKHLRSLTALARATCLEACTDRVRGPVHNAVRGVIEHLADDFPPEARIRAALHLDKGRDAVLIDEQVVKCPPPGSRLLRRHRLFARDQEPPPRCGIVYLIPRQHLGVTSEYCLEHLFGLIGRLSHRRQLIVLVDEVDAGHAFPPSQVS
jgi:hypothetical protein